MLAREVDDDEAIRELTLRAATALGVGTEADIRDYFRLSAQQVKPAIAELVAAGEIERGRRRRLVGARVSAGRPDGASAGPRHRAAVSVRPVDLLPAPGGAAVQFHYRIEIYTPAPKRQYGYYVWPLLMDGQLVARVDLKADRAADTLRVVGAFGEPDAPRARAATALAGELQSMAAWLGLSGFTRVRPG